MHGPWIGEASGVPGEDAVVIHHVDVEVHDVEGHIIPARGLGDRDDVLGGAIAPAGLMETKRPRRRHRGRPQQCAEVAGNVHGRAVDDDDIDAREVADDVGEDDGVLPHRDVEGAGAQHHKGRGVAVDGRHPHEREGRVGRALDAEEDGVAVHQPELLAVATRRPAGASAEPGDKVAVVERDAHGQQVRDP